MTFDIVLLVVVGLVVAAAIVDAVARSFKLAAQRIEQSRWL